MIHFGEFLKRDFYNLAYMGIQRTIGLNLGGHWSMLVNPELTEFVAFQFGDYANFTSIKPVKLAEVKLTPVDVAFMNDSFWDRFRNGYTDARTPTFEPIYGGAYKNLKYIWDYFEHYPLVHGLISPKIVQLDIIIELDKPEKEPRMLTHIYDFVYINKNKNYQLYEGHKRRLHICLPEPKYPDDVNKTVFFPGTAAPHRIYEPEVLPYVNKAFDALKMINDV